MLPIGIVVSVLVPLLAGLPWMLRFVDDQRPGGWPIALAYGYALGLIVIAIGIRLLDAVHVPGGFASALIVPSIAGAIGWWRYGRDVRARIRQAFAGTRTAWRQTSAMTRVAAIAAFALIVIRMTTLAIEALARPLFAWEAVGAVAVKARVWYELRKLADFVSPLGYLQGSGAFTDADPAAPMLPSLLMLWTADATGQWHEGAVGLPWWMLGIALVLALYGHLRRAGAGLAYALAFAYVLASLPLVDVQLVLPGSPQWIGAAGIGLAGFAFLRWLDEASLELLTAAIIGLALAVLSVPSAWLWAAVFIVAWTMRRFPRTAAKVAVALPLVLLLALLASMQTAVTIGSIRLQAALAIDWSQAIESMLLLDNWHLLYLVLAVIVFAARKTLLSPRWRTQTWIVAMGLATAIVAGVVSLQPLWVGGLRDFSGIALELAPILVAWIALIGRHVAVHREPGST